MSRVPGGFALSSDDGGLTEEEDEQVSYGLDENEEEYRRLRQALDANDDVLDGMDEDEDSDSDFVPTGAMFHDTDLEMTSGDEDEDDDEDAVEERETADDDDEEEQGQIQLGIDPTTRQLLVITEDGDAVPLTGNHLGGNGGTLSAIQRLLAQTFSGGGRGGAAAASAAEDGAEDISDEGSDDGWGPTRRRPKQWYPVHKEPQEAGVRLERSGDFGPLPRSALPQRKLRTSPSDIATALREREMRAGQFTKASISDYVIPRSDGVEVAQFQSKVYSGQYSSDGSFFYAACQDYCVYIYDTRQAPRVGAKSVTDTEEETQGGRRIPRYLRYSSWQHRTSMRPLKVLHALSSNMRWTITDANLSDDNEWLIYSSITPRVHLAKTSGGSGWDADDRDQETLNFAGSGGEYRYGGFGIWSLRFSRDGKEIVAGASDGQIFVYDIEAKRPVLSVNAHGDDVNAVAFADAASSNLLLSGSDDTFVKVWDRRSMQGERASGVLVGHTEGITFVEPKGDGRYCLSNGKDQGMRLWDLRMMISDDRFERLRLDRNPYKYSHPTFDYRNSAYPKPRYTSHPNDCSVMTYRGHTVLRTLIRCHFSPAETTNQRYLYSGSADGRIHIWNLDGTIAQVLNRRTCHPLMNEQGEYNDPSSYALRTTSARRGNSYAPTVRDVSWHPREPSMISTSWEWAGEHEGSLAKHEWAPRVRNDTLEDAAERQRLESCR